jgi:uncharacterized membrane protein
MQRIIETLYGRKTYIVAFVMALLNLLVAFEVISVEQLDQVNVILVALGLGAIRAGVAKAE